MSKDIPASGSLQPMTEKPQWWGGVDAASLNALSAKAEKINDKVDKMVKRAVKDLADVGMILLEAREMFKGDKEFGQWRAECTQIKSGQDAYRAMTLARGQKEGLISHTAMEKLPVGTLVELAKAPGIVVEAIERKLKKDESVTRDQVNAAKNAAADGGDKTKSTEKKKAEIAEILAQQSKDRQAEKKRMDTAGLERAKREDAIIACMGEPNHITRMEMVEELDCDMYQKAHTYFGLLTPNEGEGYGEWLLNMIQHNMEVDSDYPPQGEYATKMRDIIDSL